MTAPDLSLADRFFRAWRDADCSALAELLAPNAEWIMTGHSRFAGPTKGSDAVIDMRRQMTALTAGSWRALRDDSYDVVSSEHHIIILDRFLADREGKQLDSHEGILILPEADGKVHTILHYFFDQHHFDEFWE